MSVPPTTPRGGSGARLVPSGSAGEADNRLLQVVGNGDVKEAEEAMKRVKTLDYSVFGVGSPLTVAIRKGHLPVVSLLLEAGASPNFTFVDRATEPTLQSDREVVIPLHVACQQSSARRSKSTVLGIAKLLLDKGANVDALDDAHLTALHTAVTRQEEDLALLLVKMGADAKLRCRHGSALEMAFQRQALEHVWEDSKRTPVVFDDDSFPKRLQRCFLEKRLEREAKDKTKSLDLSDCILELLDGSLFVNALEPNVTSFPWLTTLDLRKNELKTLPFEIGLLENLENLNVAHNKLKALPLNLSELGKLQRLILSHNELDSIPSYLGLMQLQQLAIDHNPLKKMSSAVKRLNGAELLAFLKSMTEGSTVCSQAKIIVVGQEAVGKTTLLRALANALSLDTKKNADGSQIEKKKKRSSLKFWSGKGGKMDDFNLPSTDGIEISEWKEKDIVFQCWDFGGQLSFYAMHQYYLSQNCIYLVCFDLEREETINRMEYWLKTIRDVSYTAPVFVIGTHAESKKCTKEHITKMFNSVQTKYASCCNFQEAIAVGSTKGLGVKELRRRLVKVAGGGNLGGHSYPKRYLMLQERVAASRNHFMPPVIPWAKYEQIAEQCGIAKADLGAPTRFLHEMGVLLHFSKQEDIHSGLAEQVVIDPSWMTKAMTSLVSFSHSFGKKDGIMGRRELAQIWREPEFPERLHDLLLGLLEKFEVLIHLRAQVSGSGTPRSGGSSVLIPTLLPTYSMNSIDSVWPKQLAQNEQEWERIYTFRFVPMGFFGRIMVRIMRFTHPLHYWRNGIISELKRKLTRQQLFVELKEAEGDALSTIRVRARGSNPVHLLHSAIECIDKLIQHWYGKLQFSRYILCPHCVSAGITPAKHLLLNECQDAIFENKTMSCGTTPIPKSLLLPAVFLCNDLPALAYSDLTFPKKRDLGKGSFATVILGELEGQEVAVKLMNEVPPSELREKYNNFISEAFYLSSAKHPSIVRFHGVTFSPLALITEFIPHGTLYSYLHNKNNKLSYEMILKMAHNIASAVQFLHRQNPPVLHRDLKAPNVLVASLDPNVPVLVKLVDLGCSCKVVSESRAGTEIVNADWMAPEVILEQPFTEKADVYSLGIVFWELAAREHPFEEYGYRFSYQKANDIAHKRLRPTLTESCPKEFAELIQIAWDQDPALRPSASKLTKRLDALMKANGRNKGS